MNKRLRTTITFTLVFFLAAIVFYPKYKPLLAKKIKGPGIGAEPLRQAQQKLNATGFVIIPTNLSELINANGTLRPDEEVDLSFETSGKIVGINFTEGTTGKKR